MLARVIEQAYGYVTPDLREELAGKLTKGELMDEWDKPGGKYATVAKHVSTAPKAQTLVLTSMLRFKPTACPPASLSTPLGTPVVPDV